MAASTPPQATAITCGRRPRHRDFRPIDQQTNPFQAPAAKRRASGGSAACRARIGRIRSVFMAADQGVPRVPGSPSLYRKVAEDIKAAIAAGGYAAGTRLPSEHELAERYSVSRG